MKYVNGMRMKWNWSSQYIHKFVAMGELSYIQLSGWEHVNPVR